MLAETRRSLEAVITGRTQSLFARDMDSHSDAITESFAGKRALIIGGAGSIGGATLRSLLQFRPAGVDVIDHDENGLAELARDLRSSALVACTTQVRLMPLDYGSELARRFYASAEGYDAVLHFAALKHVRSEKHPLSILQMIETNVLRQQDLLSWLAATHSPVRYFAVSTDKAANPVNFMGASKRLMELMLFTDEVSPLSGAIRTSARFANVAFSAGSLLAGFSERIERRQPLAVPLDTRRFFVTLEESAHICLLAAAAIPSRHVAIPELDPQSDLRELTPIAEAFIASAGFSPRTYTDEAEARAAVDSDSRRGRWPLLLTPRDTDGEKPAEEFLGTGEHAVKVGLAALLAVPQEGIDSRLLGRTLHQLRLWSRGSDQTPSKADIAAVLRLLTPEFEPIEAGRSLDDRM